MKVTLSEDFKNKVAHFPKTDRIKIAEFIQYVENHGLNGLKGRNKNSDNIPKDDPHWANKVKYAQKHYFWHYHIGIPYYEIASNGEQVSEYILHYQHFDDRIHIVAMTYHPPFNLPTESEIL